MSQNKQPSLRKNYLYNLIYTLLNTALPLLTAPYLARTIGVEGTGIYAFFYSYAHLFFVFAKLGLTNYGTREISRARQNGDVSRVFSEIYLQQVLVALVVNLAYGAYCFAFMGHRPDRVYALIMWIIVFGGVLDIDWLFSGLEAFKLISVRNSAVKIATVVLIFTLVKRPEDLWIYTLLMSCGLLLGQLSMWISVRKYVRIQRVPLKAALKHLRPNAVLVIPVLAMTIYRYMDKIMLGSMSGMIDTGLYENAEKIIYALCGFINSFGTVMMPRMSNMMTAGESDKSATYIRLSMQFMMCLMFGMAFGLLAVSNDLVIILFGQPFADSGPLMAALAFTLPAMGWSNVIRTQFVIPTGRDSIYIYTVSAGAVINLIVNAICIPRFGAMGAVIGTICAEFGVDIAQFVMLRKHLSYAQLLKKALFAPVCGGLMYAAILPLGSLGLSRMARMSAQIAAGVLAYLILVTLYITLFEKDIAAQVRRRVRRGK